MKTDVNRLLKFNSFIEYCIYNGIKSVTLIEGFNGYQDIKEYFQTYNATFIYNDGQMQYSISGILFKIEKETIRATKSIGKNKKERVIHL